MSREDFNDLYFFLAVAKEKSFTRAAAQLGVSQSALSHAMKSFEERVGVRLLTRTTRSVSLTEAGERLLQTVAPRYEDVKEELAALSDYREKPAGSIRITATDYAIDTVLWPKLKDFLPQYPDIHVELSINYGFSDIVSERYDAGVRLGAQVSDGMIAARIGPDIRYAVVGAPHYFDHHPVPEQPQDLVQHTCVNLRLPTYGNLYAWEFEKDGREQKIRVNGQVTCNSIFHVLDAVQAGFGLAHMPEELAQPLIDAGKLRRVLQDWCPLWTGYHLYYANRRQSSRAMSLLVEALRYRG